MPVDWSRGHELLEAVRLGISRGRRTSVMSAAKISGHSSPSEAGSQSPIQFGWVVHPVLK